MSADRHLQLQALFEGACAVPAAERSAWLDAHCEDESLRAELCELLEHDESADFLTSDHAPGSRFHDAGAMPAMPQALGGFELHEEIGRGGMGIVFRASQRSPERAVAVKVLAGASFSPDSRRRFELEAEALGRLQHPGIAQIHAAGEGEHEGHRFPYLAMELVRGKPLDAWAKASRPPLEQRIRLLIELCAAMQHAHQRGLIHRDLKPANILVDEHGRPRILDFGIARLTSEESAATLQTRTGQVLGTLAYMSPEQAAGGGGGVDARSDVHALGVIGFELLSGKLPYELVGVPITRALLVLSSEEPRRLSAVQRQLRGDLDTVIGKALERDPARRYASAAEFGADLQRFLDHQAITARAPTALYQLRKLARRHVGWFVGGAVAVAALVVGTALSVRWALQAEDSAVRARTASRAAERAADRERDANRAAQRSAAAAQRSAAAAIDQAERATFVSDFAELLFRAAAPEVSLGKEISAISLVREGQRRALALPDDRPVLRAEVSRFISVVLREMGEYDAAAPLMARTLADLERGLDVDDRRMFEALFEAAALDLQTGNIDSAEERFQAALEMHERLGGAEDRSMARCLEGLAEVDRTRERHERSLERFERSLAIRERLVLESGESAGEAAVDSDYGYRGVSRHHALSSVLMNVAMGRLQLGNVEAAEPLAARAIELAEQIDSPELLASHATALGNLRLRQRRIEDAEVLFTKALGAGERIYGADHPRLVPRLINLGSMCGMTGRIDVAETHLQRAVEILDSRNLGSSDYAARALLSLGNIDAQRGKLGEALERWRRAAAIQEELAGPESPQLASILENMARAEQMSGNAAEAERLQARVRAIRAK